MIEWLSDPNAWLGLLTLTALEIVLGIDNIIFISILSSKLRPEEQPRARKLGLMGAFVSRVLLLLSIAWVVKLTTPLFHVVSVPISGRSLILIVGGLFLIAKATYEIHGKLEGEDHEGGAKALPSLAAVVAQIMVIDIVFSLDSVITAVGMARAIIVMMTAMIIAVGVMFAFAGVVSEFVNRHPSMKILALAFLLLIGVLLTADAFGQHINRGYVYFAMAFSLVIELLNMRFRKKKSRTVAPIPPR